MNKGRRYAYSDGVPYDMKQAVKWYLQAAKKGCPEAQNAVGICYEQGDGVSSNMRKAVKYYKMAAETGLATAQINLAECYEKGKGVTKNLAEAESGIKKRPSKVMKRAGRDSSGAIVFSTDPPDAKPRIFFRRKKFRRIFLHVRSVCLTFVRIKPPKAKIL